MPDSELKRHHYPSLGDAVGPYVHATEHNGTLYTSGFTAFGTDAQHLGVGPQLKAIYSQLSAIAEHHQTTLDSIIKVTVYITDVADIPEARDALFEVYGEKYPASAMVQVEGLFHPDLKAEVEAVVSLT
ncbi:enamine deaminase RidA [Vibrio nigripulchritudo]|uniref:RidA family protein n=1 Tax=Vibrio nigripulchritudo TaxID=28173 RepID=UPI00190A91ED|nr:RidA family protein [Vibrio nigripulchritudo]BCL73556.1 enamine deaminase RidA [Vibrio nigripulchritudo]BDU34924.1 enamine deaminase RidA [Vibrio nigripulchritudo]